MKTKKAKKIARKGHPIHQVAALPYRRPYAGAVEFLLLTSRNTRRFLIPKGWTMKGKTPQEAAAIEAQQEAGVTGRIDPTPIGAYQYWKRMKNAFVPVHVTVYALEVETELSNWKERRQRQRKWLTSHEAASLVDEPGLVSLLAGFQPQDLAAE
ncbi:NUDIX hydrolase [Mesorhizobium sp. BAC0120]|uniref:NUDIX hydrolase n=1 Tax=Mesorhizobium sp. BAC0120 TaxID=3090670 RepID=UPI00298C0A50|nr:NUDIX hydrolase [Mesorhizobium sp. BAC0120]MDW6021005.1 NUDIX hydrolase [Mesorhizobium sp. BAC0120]